MTFMGEGSSGRYRQGVRLKRGPIGDVMDRDNCFHGREVGVIEYVVSRNRYYEGTKQRQIYLETAKKGG